MKLGLNRAGNAVYFIYSFFCHQLPERSFFLFGQKTMYSLNQIQRVWQDTINIMESSLSRSKTKIRALLADDHHMVREGIRQLLESAKDIEVVAGAGDGEEAQSLIEQLRPDVAVLDIQMPKASGIEVTRWVRSHLPEVGVLVLTAYDDDPYVMAVLQAGANGYVLKTAKAEDLIQAVRDVYEGKSALDPSITKKLMSNLFNKHENRVIEPLTDRELDVLRLAAKGYTNKAIGMQLHISDRTVQGHLAHIFSKMQAASRTEAVMRAVSLGWISQGSESTAEE
jgi:DNA-binding NarL/FixJ family response regulator